MEHIMKKRNLLTNINSDNVKNREMHVYGQASIGRSAL